MINRYSVNEIQKIWSDENKLQKWWTVELAVTKAWNKIGIISNQDLDNIITNVNISLNRMLEIEVETKHDVVAFTRMISETLKKEAKWIHLGITSTDIVDTAQNLMIKECWDIFTKDIDKLQNQILKLAKDNKQTLIMGRSHGIFGEPTSLGLKFLLWFTEINRQIKRINAAFNDVCVAKISGSMGNYANLELEIEASVAKQLNLPIDILSTQVSQRDRHASLILTIANLASTFEKISTEIRLYNRSEVQELCEGFDAKQKGSSSMPHKKNPISSENITGLSRMLKAYVTPALENNVLWHERDISHSSNERIIFPDMFNLLVYITRRMNDIIKNLYINKSKMMDNINSSNNVFYSQVILTYILKKTNVSREKAYDLIQQISLNSVNNNKDFLELIKNDSKITKLISEKEIESICELKYFLRNVDKIFSRVEKNLI